MNKIFMATLALSAAAYLSTANAYSFDATYRFTIETCNGSEGNTACQTGSAPGSLYDLTLRVFDYPSDGKSFSAELATFTLGGVYTGNGMFYGGVSGNSGFTFEGATSGYEFSFNNTGVPSLSLAPWALAHNLASGNFRHSISHNAFFVNTSGNMQLTTFRDTTVMTAVPEPESYAMLLAGIGLLGSIARRRKNGGAA